MILLGIGNIFFMVTYSAVLYSSCVIDPAEKGWFKICIPLTLLGFIILNLTFMISDIFALITSTIMKLLI